MEHGWVYGQVGQKIRDKSACTLGLDEKCRQNLHDPEDTLYEPRRSRCSTALSGKVCPLSKPYPGYPIRRRTSVHANYSMSRDICARHFIILSNRMSLDLIQYRPPELGCRFHYFLQPWFLHGMKW
jgi:hypothetical protein